MSETYLAEMEIIDCPRCGMAFGLTRDYMRRRVDDGGDFSCPKGHVQSYRDTTVKRLKRRVATLEGEEAELRERVKDAKRLTTTARAAATRAKNRAKAGVCQFCNRQVRQMAAHVRSKHPKEVED